MHEHDSVVFENVSKVYNLYSRKIDQVIDVFGLKRFGLRTKTAPRQFSSLDNISFSVKKGQRLGIIGQNGAGKTTLLKLVCGNFAPTHGRVQVNGSVQALMNTGLGFHPEYTGRENVAAALQYNGLAKSDYDEAIAGIIDFCELGEFLDQPFRTYSLGMQARLMFAAATAIKPDILIVDEMLGAGDAYFVAKSKTRVENMISGGCTMLLVSHSMQQVLELCDRVLWLEHGGVRTQGDPLEVVKAYEHAQHGRVSAQVRQASSAQEERGATGTEDLAETPAGIAIPFASPRARTVDQIDGLRIQEPAFIPQRNEVLFPKIDEAVLKEFRHVARGGITRWDSEVGVKLTGFNIVTQNGLENRLRALQPVKIAMALTAEKADAFRCRYGLVFNDTMGKTVTTIWSPPDRFSLAQDETKIVEMILNPLQIGPGHYTIGISVLEETPIELLNKARRFDLLGRSFQCEVDMEDSLAAISAGFIHSAEWKF